MKNVQIHSKTFLLIDRIGDIATVRSDELHTLLLCLTVVIVTIR